MPRKVENSEENMRNLEYRIGELVINPSMLGFDVPDPIDTDYANHKFVAEALDNVVSIYVAQEGRHKSVAGKFGLENQIVGGGSCYLNNENQLVLTDTSRDYDAIPKEAAQRFAELMIPELQKLGVEVSGIEVDPYGRKYSINPFWSKENAKR